MKMKKCPKCKAELQEEARFCLYCMTSFEEKQTIKTPKENSNRWLYIIATVLVVMLIIAGVMLFMPKDNHSAVSSDIPDDLSTSSDLTTSNTNSASSEQQSSELESYETSTHESSEIQSSSKNQNDTSNEVSSSTIDNNISTLDNSKNSTSTSSVVTNYTSSDDTTVSSPSIDSSTMTSSDLSTSSASSETEVENSSSENNAITPSEVTYVYRDAKYGDDFSISTDFENAVVITGVETVSPDGEYRIPDTIDGKKVVAVMGLAFCADGISDTVKKVFVPSTVKTIWNYAFADCYNLTDIYFCGNSIYTESNAFPESSKRNGVLTIHCSANCSDRNFRYYKDSASNYNAEYAEWNG